MPEFWWQPFILDIAQWWVAVTLVGWLAYPFVFRTLRLLPDRGLGVTKLAGLVLWVFLGAWVSYAELDASLPQTFTGAPGWAWVSAGLLAVLSALALAPARVECWTFLRKRWRLALGYEVGFLAAFCLFLWFRSYIPDVTYDTAWGGAEKWGNLAILTSLWRNPVIPPLDPWLAGYSLNYYYFSHLIWATLARLSGVAPPVAFNLGLATLFALLLLTSFSAGWSVTERRKGGWWAVFLIAFAGTPATWTQVHRLVGYWSDQGFGIALRAFDFWGPSDVIPDTRNEFPAFNWLLGDLHAHGTGFLLLLLALCILVQLERVRELRHGSWRSLVVHQPMTWALLCVVMAAMWATNGWDLVVLGLLGGIWILSQSLRSHSRGAALAQSVQGLLIWAITGALAIGFLASFYTAETHLPLVLRHPGLARLPSVLGATGSLGLVEAAWRTTPAQWALFWGLFAGTWLMLHTPSVFRSAGADWAWRSGRRGWSGLNSPWFAFATVALLVGVIAWHRGDRMPWVAIGAFGGLCVCAAALGSRIRPRATTQWAALLAAGALICILIPELLFVDDTIGPPNQRYNTVFKLYYPAWGLAALATALVLSTWTRRPSPTETTPSHSWPTDSIEAMEADDAAILRREDHDVHETRWTRRLGRWAVVCAVLIAGGLYPLLGVASRVAAGQNRLNTAIKSGMSAREALRACRTLDGLAFMSLPEYAPDDLRLALWMRDHLFPLGQESAAVRTPGYRLAEMPGESYTIGGRFATVTGVPCLMAWPGHQSQWRGSEFVESIWPGRADCLARLYSTEDPDEALEICRSNGLRWVLVGQLERQSAPPAALRNLNDIGREVMRFGDSVLYEVPMDAVQE